MNFARQSGDRRIRNVKLPAHPFKKFRLRRLRKSGAGGPRAPQLSFAGAASACFLFPPFFAASAPPAGAVPASFSSCALSQVS